MSCIVFVKTLRLAFKFTLSQWPVLEFHKCGALPTQHALFRLFNIKHLFFNDGLCSPLILTFSWLMEVTVWWLSEKLYLWTIITDLYNFVHIKLFWLHKQFQCTIAAVVLKKMFRKDFFAIITMGTIFNMIINMKQFDSKIICINILICIYIDYRTVIEKYKV